MNNMATIHDKMSRHLVTIKIKVDENADEDDKEYQNYDGTVLSSQQNLLYIIASSEFRDKIDSNLIQVQLPNEELITIERDCFDIADPDSGIVGIRCPNPTPGVECGFGDLEPIDICEDPVQELQGVYTYSHHSKPRLLTPGSIMLVDEDTFDHSCVRYLKTHKGTPVVNAQGHYVGFCFSHKGYLISYNMREVAARIERNQGRQFMRISDTFRHLRQQCRVIQFHLRRRVVLVKTQRIGQPGLTPWENLEELRQQHPAFHIEEETEQSIQQALADRLKGHFYVRVPR